MVENPQLRLDMARLDRAGAAETPRSTRRHVSRKLSRYIEFFERKSSDAPQTARATINTTPRTATPRIRDIIKQFDPANEPPKLQRAQSLQPVSSVASSPGIVKWTQVEKRVAGTVVGKVWRKIEEPLPTDTGIFDTCRSEPRATEGKEDQRRVTEGRVSEGRVSEGRLSEGRVSEGRLSESRVSESRLSEGRLHELSSSEKRLDDPSLERHFDTDDTRHFDPIGEESEEEEEEDSSPRARSSIKTVPPKPKRASHFVAIRIDDPQVVDAVRRFQHELTNSAPFLDHCKSNPNKLHLTLLVLSLNAHEIERAKLALVSGVRRFMSEKASMLAALPRKAEFMAAQSSFPPQFFGACTSTEESSAFELDFRTIGAFGTRVLFLSPPLRQRLLLQSFHVELARAFGDQGIPIVGAGSGWNSAMEIQKQVRGEVPDPPPAPAEPPRPVTQPPPPPKTPPSAPPTAKTPPAEAMHVFPETATPLDKALLRQYDLSSARTTLYIPQITLFKISKAAKRNKSKQTAAQTMPKLKLFPRLYHNLVQRVLQSGLPPPRPLRSRESSSAPASTDKAPFVMDWSNAPTPVYIYQLPAWVAQDKFAYGSPVESDYQRPPDFQRLPSDFPDYQRPEYQRMASDFQRVPEYQRPEYQRAEYQRMASDFQRVPEYPRPEYQRPMWKYDPSPRYSSPGGYLHQPSTPVSSRSMINPRNGSARRLKVDRIVTTSQLPDPPFGRQRCVFIELLEMSQMDSDGYYKRICRVELSPTATLLPL